MNNELITNNSLNNTQFLDATNHFLKSITIKATTKEAYKKGITYFYNYMQENNLTQINEETLQEYRQYLIEHNEAPSINLYLSSIKRLCKYLNKHYGIIDPSEELKGVKIEKGNKKDSLTLNQTKDLLQLDLSPRDKALTHLLLTGALRTIEIIRANIEDITTSGNNFILRVQGKGEDTKNNFVFLTDSTYKLLNEYLKTRKGTKATDPLFTSESRHNKNGRLTTRSIRRIIKSELATIGINTPKITTHSLRHTAINLAIDNGADLLEAQQLARHKSPTTTQQNYIDARLNVKAKEKTASILENILTK